MTLRLHWFMPLHGDGRDVAKSVDGSPTPNIRRAPDIDYLSQVAGAIDGLGFAGALIPTGMFCEDPWLVSSALAAHTKRMHFMIALRPGSVPPMVAAQMAATFQRISHGRLMINIVTGGDADEQKRYGDWLDHDQRYDRTAEYLDVWSRAWTGEPFDFEGEHFHIKAGLLTRPHPVRPPVLVGGSSAGAQQAAAAHADVYLSWGETPDGLATLTKEVTELAAQHERTVEFGTRFHIISRETSQEAWEVTERLLAGMDAERIAKAQQRFGRTESEGQRRMAALHGGRTDSLEIYPNVWAGYGLVRPGAGVALVGSHEEVAARIEEYHDIGLRHLILSGQPHLEEAYAFGEGVMPILRRRGLLDRQDEGAPS